MSHTFMPVALYPHAGLDGTYADQRGLGRGLQGYAGGTQPLLWSSMCGQLTGTTQSR